MAWTAPRTWVTGEIVTSSLMNTHVRDNLLAAVPVGTILPFAGTSAPNSLYLLCQGQAVSRSTYSVLFGLIAGTYGNGDGSTTFNVPDLRGRMIVGSGGAVGIGGNDGRALNLRSPSHAHRITLYQTSTGVALPNDNLYSSNGAQSSHYLQTTGDGNNLDAPAYLVINYILKALQS